MPTDEYGVVWPAGSAAPAAAADMMAMADSFKDRLALRVIDTADRDAQFSLAPVGTVVVATGSKAIWVKLDELTATWWTVGEDTDWVAWPPVAELFGTLQYRVSGSYVSVQIDAAYTTNTGVVHTLNSTALPLALRPGTQVRTGGYFGGHPGNLTVNGDGNLQVIQQTGSDRGSVAGIVSYPVEL